MNEVTARLECLRLTIKNNGTLKHAKEFSDYVLFGKVPEEKSGNEKIKDSEG